MEQSDAAEERFSQHILFKEYWVMMMIMKMMLTMITMIRWCYDDDKTMTFQAVGGECVGKLGGSLLCTTPAARTFDEDWAWWWWQFDDDLMMIWWWWWWLAPNGKEEGGGLKEGKEDAVHQLVQDHLQRISCKVGCFSVRDCDGGECPQSV